MGLWTSGGSAAGEGGHMPFKRVMIGLATTGCLTLQKMSQGNVSQERQSIRVTATSAACTVPPLPSAPYCSSQYQVDRTAPRLRLIGGCIQTRRGEGAGSRPAGFSLLTFVRWFGFADLCAGVDDADCAAAGDTN